MRRFIAAVSLALAASPAIGAAGPAILTVEAVLSPAWVERANGRREPLAAGMALGNREKIHTGDGGRAMLRLAEGSAIKLGESALLAVDDLAHKPAARGGLVSASLDVVRGAFRFTTALLAKSRSQRDVRVKINAITAGIRGTDVWGRSNEDRDIVCLLEGRITVSHGSAQFTMSEPNSFYIAPRVGQAQPPSAVSPQQVKEWSDETEIFPQMGGARAGGSAVVVAASARDRAAANAVRDKLRESGFPAAVARAGQAFEVRLESFGDSAEAAVVAERLRRVGFPQARAQ